MVAGDQIEFPVAEIGIGERGGTHVEAVGLAAIARIADAGFDAFDLESLLLRGVKKLAAAGADIENAHAGPQERGEVGQSALRMTGGTLDGPWRRLLAAL